jgi:hypothetical protein
MTASIQGPDRVTGRASRRNVVTSGLGLALLSALPVPLGVPIFRGDAQGLA